MLVTVKRKSKTLRDKINRFAEQFENGGLERRDEN